MFRPAVSSLQAVLEAGGSGGTCVRVPDLANLRVRACVVGVRQSEARYSPRTLDFHHPM